MPLHRHRPAALAAAVLLGVSACTTVSDPPPPPLTLVAERLEQLEERGTEFSQLTVTPEKATAFARHQGEMASWLLSPTLSQGEASRLPYPSVSFAAAPPSEIAAEAQELAAACSDTYEVQVTALTPSALLGEASCPEATSVRLGGEPLPRFSGQWTADDWQRLLDLVTAVNGSPMIESVRVAGDGRVDLRLGNTAETNGCRPALSLVGDGSAATWSCLRRLDPAPGTLDAWTGATVAAAVDRVATDAGLTPGPDVTVAITPSGTALDITVEGGADRGHAVVEP